MAHFFADDRAARAGGREPADQGAWGLRRRRRASRPSGTFPTTNTNHRYETRI
jgi:hypothetical protein